MDKTVITKYLEEKCVPPPNTCILLKANGYPPTVLSWYRTGDGDRVQPTDASSRGILGPAPLVEELLAELRWGENAWKMPDGKYANNRVRGGRYPSPADALAHSWIDHRINPDDPKRKFRSSWFINAADDPPLE